jgi:hypothetical protein
VQLADADAEDADRTDRDRPGDLLQVRGDRVEGAAELVIVQRDRGDAEDLRDRPVAGPVLTCTSGAGEVSRLQIIASMACPMVTVATPRTGTRSSITWPMPSREQKEAMTGREPSILACRSGTSA